MALRRQFMPSLRTQSKLPNSLHQRLNTYAVAAGAGGVALLALTTPSEAEIIYTPADVVIGRDASYRLDINHDGFADFAIIEFAGRTQFRTSQFLNVAGVEGNEINCASTFCATYNSARAFVRGGQIGPNERQHGWDAQAGMAFEELFRLGTQQYGEQWVNVSAHYLGLRFKINGETHYGWARLNVKFQGGLQGQRTWKAQLTGYAYETVADKGITAGQTSETDYQELEGQSDQYPPEKPVRAIALSTLGSLSLGYSGIAL
jgi:hypothetical protein